MIGRTISHYKILDKLGEGGMGVVYKAEDTRLKRTVALKFLPPELTRDKSAKARFIHEAQAASALDHPNICTIHEIDETDDGRMFICMACYEGETLKDIIARQPLNLKRAIDVAMRVAAGLAKAHNKGIIHRDLKPANILVTNDGQTKIVDFGLAKLSGRTKLTKTGMTAGTIAYMAPEQTRGQESDARSDIWSLGITLYEMITGQAPFKSDYDEAVVYSILNEPAEPVTGLRTGVPLELERIVTKCLEKDPGERYQSADELIADLRHLKRTMGDRSGATTGSPPVRPRRWWAWVVGAVVFFAIVVGVITRFRVPPGPSTFADKTMIVVLPFDNLGLPEDEYFAAGVTEEITSRLASIGELGVISRKSAVHYADSDLTAKQIGAELGVQYVIEGTVRWARDDGKRSRVRIVPELVRVADDTRLWSEVYDQVIEDVFEVQSDIAAEVVGRLGLALFDLKTAPDDGPPTANLDAYQAYLRGGYYTRLPHFTVSEWMRAIESYTRAVTLDPGFALAYAKLSEAHARLYYYRVDLSEERKMLAKAALDSAAALKPDLPETHLAAGYYLLMVERDVERAFAEFAVVPENAELLEAKGDGYRQQGRWREAFDHYERACRLSPRNSSPLVEIAISGWLYRRYDEAVDAANQAIMIAPDQAWPYLAKGVTYWSWRGRSDDARRAFELVPSDHNWYPWVWYWQLVYEGDYRAALEYLTSVPGEWVSTKIGARPVPLFEAYAHEALNQPELAAAAYERAKGLLEIKVSENPRDPRYHSSLGIVSAALGQKAVALREGKRAVELLPLSKDAVYGLPYVIDLAHIYVLLGDNEKALAKIEEMLSIPSSLSVPLLKIDPRWAPLRGDPHFQSLLEKYSVAES